MSESFRSIGKYVTRPFLVLLLITITLSARAQYAVGDLGSTASGNWTALATWSTWNGVAWVPAPALPNAGSRVHILNGRTVLVNGTGPYAMGDLLVENGGRLWSGNNPVNVYLTVYGSVVQCDGQIGDGENFDGLSFNIDGANVSIQGTGNFDASRLRKNFAANATTNLTIAMDINLRFNMASTTQIYNNHDGTTLFNVTINAGVTVTLTGAIGSGNVAIDGIDGLSPWARGGTFTVNGTLIIPGILFLTTNNTNVAQQCRFVINNGGLIRTNQINASASGAGGHALTMNAGGTLEITGSPTAWTAYSTVNNFYGLNAASRVIYSGMGAQDVRAVAGGYGHLDISGTGVKSLFGVTSVKGALTISNVLGTPELDVTASNFQLTVMGNWTSYDESGFNERTGLARVVFSGAAAQTINTTGGERFNNLRLAKTLGTSASLISDVIIARDLELNTGILDLNGRMITLSSSTPAAISTTSTFGPFRHIRSEWVDNSARVRWNVGTTTGAFTIPFGAGGELIPVIFDHTAGNAGHVVVATYGTGPENQPWPVWPVPVLNLQSSTGLQPDNQDATVDRFWQVDVEGTSTANLTLNYRASELPLSPYDSAIWLYAQRYNGTTNTWMPPVEGQMPQPYTVTVPGATQFGPWAIAAIISPLPVELFMFEARAKEDVVNIEWKTASERDSHYFEIQRSADGEHFDPVAIIPAQGYSQSITRYNTVDVSPLAGLSYYRLRQVDLDGTSTLGPVAVVHRLTAGPTLYPNPVEDLLHVDLLDIEAHTLTIHDALGSLVLQYRITGTSHSVHVGHLPAGQYVLRAEGRNTGSPVRFIKH